MLSPETQRSFEELKNSAEQGDAEAQYKLGLMYFEGTEIVKDLSKAETWISNAAKNGSVDAQMFLGYCLETGQFGRVEYELPFALYQSAAEKGNIKALLYIGNMYMTGTGTNQDTQKAIEYFFKAASHNEPISQMHIGDFYFFGKYGFEQNYQEAFSWYEKAALQGDPESQYKLGYCYNFGLGIIQDFNKAMEYYTLAANQNMEEAQFNLGNHYLNGNGVEKNEKLALEWYLKAAGNGYAKAQYNVGLLYYYGGEGIEINYLEAERWYIKAAENGEAKAALELGDIYIDPPEGSGINMSLDNSNKYYVMGANLGNPEAMEKAAIGLMLDANVELNLDKSFATRALETLNQSQHWANEAEKAGNKPHDSYYDLVSKIRGNIYTVLYVQENNLEYVYKALESYRNVKTFDNDFDSIYNYAYIASKAPGCSAESFETFSLIVNNADENYDRMPIVLLRLSEMYLYGEGCQQDIDNAYILACRAYNLGEECESYLARFTKKFNGHYKFRFD